MTDNILLSYWYTRKSDMDKLLRPYAGASVFADSGAFSAMTTGAQIDVHQYAEWLLRWRHNFTVHSNLDVVGDPLATARNQAILEDRYGLEPLPVFHAGSPWSELEQLVERYPYIALGGVAKRQYNAKMLMPWMVQCFRIAGTRSQFHGFGVTDWKLMSSLPWRSVDSTSWMMGARYGSQLIFAHNRLFQTRIERMDRYADDLRRLGFTVAQAKRATIRGTKGGDDALSKEIAIASIGKAQEHLRRKFNTDVRIYLAGLL